MVYLVQYESKLGHNSPLYERSDETSSEKLLNQVEFMFKRFYVHQQTNTNEYYTNKILSAFIDTNFLEKYLNKYLINTLVISK
jgi:hypothetical protein